MASADSTQTRKLLDLVRAGDRTACDRLFARHRAYLRNVIKMRLDRALRALSTPPTSSSRPRSMRCAA
jgi:hypothetical protein